MQSPSSRYRICADITNVNGYNCRTSAQSEMRRRGNKTDQVILFITKTKTKIKTVFNHKLTKTTRQTSPNNFDTYTHTHTYTHAHAHAHAHARTHARTRTRTRTRTHTHTHTYIYIYIFDTCVNINSSNASDTFNLVIGSRSNALYGSSSPNMMVCLLWKSTPPWITCRYLVRPLFTSSWRASNSFVTTTFWRRQRHLSKGPSLVVCMVHGIRMVPLVVWYIWSYGTFGRMIHLVVWYI